MFQRALLAMDFSIRDQEVAVVGGNTAAEEALYLSRICSKVHFDSLEEISSELKKFLETELLKLRMREN